MNNPQEICGFKQQFVVAIYTALHWRIVKIHLQSWWWLRVIHQTWELMNTVQTGEAEEEEEASYWCWDDVLQGPIPADWHQRGDQHGPHARGEDAGGQEDRQHRRRGGAGGGPAAQDWDRPGNIWDDVDLSCQPPLLRTPPLDCLPAIWRPELTMENSSTWLTATAVLSTSSSSPHSSWRETPGLSMLILRSVQWKS